jgi:hypothetical protein
MGNQKLSLQVLNALKDFIKAEDYGPCIMFQVFKGGDLAVLWQHWRYTTPAKAPRVFIGGKFKQQQPIIKYIWLDTIQKKK